MPQLLAFRWKAGINERFLNVTVGEARSLAGLLEDIPKQPLSPPPVHPQIHLPISFDARAQWPHAIHPIRDQVCMLIPLGDITSVDSKMFL